MKRILVTLLYAAVLSVGHVVVSCAGGAGPGAPSVVQFDSSGTVIGNIVNTTNTQWRWIVCKDGTCDTSHYIKSLSNVRPNFSITGVLTANRFDIDTVEVGSDGSIRINGDRIKDFTGAGLRLNTSTGQLEDILGQDGTITSPEVQNYTLLPIDQDTAPKWYFWQTAFARDTATADSALATVRSAKYMIGSKRLSVAAPTNQYIMTYDAGKDSVIWQAAPGAAGGDAVYIDTGAADGNVWSPVNPVFRFVGATTAILGSDTAVVTFSGVNAVSIDGDTAATGKTWRWPGGTFTALDYVGADTVSASVIEGSTVQGTLISNSLRTTGASNLRLATYSTSGSIEFGHDTTFGANADFRIIGRNLYGAAGVKSFISWMNSVTADTGIFGGQIINDDASIASEQEISDSLSYMVRTSGENWRDKGSDSAIVHTGPFTNDTALFIYRTLSGDDSTTLTTKTGWINITAPTGVKITGGAGTPTFSGGLTLVNQNVDSVGTIDANIVSVDSYIQLNGSTGSIYGRILPPTSGTLSLTWPSADGTSGQALVTNGSGALSFATVSGGSGGYPLSVGTGAAGNTVDSAVILGRNGIAVSITKVLGVADSIIFVASGLTASNFATDADIATEAEVGDTATALRTLEDEFKHTGTMTGTTGSDFIYAMSATAQVPALIIQTSHTGADTTSILPDTGAGLVIGRSAVGSKWVIDSDSMRVRGTSKIVWGVGGFVVDSADWDSLWNNTNSYRGSGGVAGDITAVGSMTSGAVFADGTANADWLGLGAAAGRIAFWANGAGTADDNIHIPIGTLSMGLDSSGTCNGMIIKKTSTAAVKMMIENMDSASGSHTELSLWANKYSSVGGTAYIGLNIDESPVFNIGVQSSDSSALKIGLKNSVGSPFASAAQTVLQIDTLGEMVFFNSNKAWYGTSAVADSALATVGYVKKRIPYYNTATDVVWNYPTADADTSMHATFPYSLTYDTTYLVKVSTSTGADTVFGLVIPFYIQDSVTVDSFIIWAATSSATADSSKIDSVHFTSEHADSVITNALTSNTTDRVGTTLTRYAMVLSRTAVPGEIIRARVVCALKQDESYVTIRKAQIKGSKRS